MQRHKKPLDFLESPYQGSKRFKSPVLAARKPYLAPSVFTQELNTKWVSPQFQGDGASPCKRIKKGNKQRKHKTLQNGKTKQTMSKEIVNLFPELNFVSCIGNETGLPVKNNDLITRSTIINNISEKEQSSTQENSRRDGTFFLFMLGSPKSPTVSGDILVQETPEEQIAVGNWMKRLRPRKRVSILKE